MNVDYAKFQKKNMIVEQFQGNYLNSRNGYQPSGILSNDDGDGKENGKKAIGLDWQNNKFIT